MPLIIDLGLKEQANKLGLGSFDPKLYRLVKGNANYSILTPVLLKAGPRPTARERPASPKAWPGGPGPIVPDFPLFFPQRQIHAHAQTCIGFGREHIRR